MCQKVTLNIDKNSIGPNLLFWSGSDLKPKGGRYFFFLVVVAGFSAKLEDADVLGRGGQVVVEGCQRSKKKPLSIRKPFCHPRESRA